MTTAPPPLPPRNIQPGVSPWRALAPRLVIPLVVAMALVLALNHRSSGVIGALGVLVLFGLLLGIEVPLLLRNQRRRQEERLRNLPSGAFYACRCSTVLPNRRAVATGNMILDQQGLTFTPAKGDPLVLGWREVTSIQLRRARSQPLAGSLVLTGSDGAKHTFIVKPPWDGLAKVLGSAP